MKVGFVINSRVPGLAGLRHGMHPAALLRGWDDAHSPMSFMRFHWIADELEQDGQLSYELYRPGRHYPAVVFVKSMGDRCLQLARRLRAAGTTVLFDANVDYYTEQEGQGTLGIAAVSARQREDAIAMTAEADQVLASSRHLASVCGNYSRCPAAWIPDNVNFDYVPIPHPRPPARPLRLWWSGMPEKMVDFLAVEDALRSVARHIELRFVTHGRPQLKSPDLQQRLERLLNDVPHVFHPFKSIRRLLALYAQSGLIVSPRFLDGPYNLGHSEWKITLGMACGLPALCSPVPSYCDVAEKAQSTAIRIACSPDEWTRALEAALSREWNLADSAEAAREVVEHHYSTPVVAHLHGNLVLDACRNR